MRYLQAAIVAIQVQLAISFANHLCGTEQCNPTILLLASTTAIAHAARDQETVIVASQGKLTPRREPHYRSQKPLRFVR